MTTVPVTQPTIAPAEAPKRRPPLRLIEPRRARRRRTGAGALGTLLIVLLFACVFAVVVFQVLLVQSQSRLDELNAQIGQQETVGKQLRHQITNLESPERIVGAARDRLNMVSPPDVGYLEPKPEDDSRAQYAPAAGQAAASRADAAAPSTTTAPPITPAPPAAGGNGR